MGLPAEPARRVPLATGTETSAGPAIGAQQSAAQRLVASVRHEFQEAREPRPGPPKARRDSRGRRLRSSAYIYGPHASREGRGGHRAPGVFTSVLPAGVKIALVLFIAAGAFLGSSQAYINYAADLPDAHAITAEPLPEDSLLYASDGTLLADIHQPGLQHYYEPLDTMGRYLPQATIAIEDSNFWNEPGIDVGAMARAAWVDWREKRPVQGASTITQQLVKLRLIGNQPSIDRKLKEAILAVQVEHVYSKRQILEQYLNTISYSNNAQGSLAAARIYFHKQTKDLDLAQASMLAGIPQSPFYNSPLLNPDGAKRRQHEVLAAMVKQRMITQDEADQAYGEDVTSPGHIFNSATPELRAAGRPSWVAPGFTDWVIGLLRSRYGDKATFGGGLRVTTTLNLALQAGAEATIAGAVKDNRGRNASSGAMVAIDPRTGAVVAMVGSDPSNPTQNGAEYNLAVWPPRNPGSSFKIYNYTAAIESGKFTMNTTIYDTTVTIDQPGGPPYKPENYDHRLHGSCTLQQCIGNSLNIPAVKVEAGTGVDRVVDMARRMGAPPWQNHGSDAQPNWVGDDPVQNFGYSLTLGGYGETPLQMATGAAVLGAQGVYHQPFGIASIKDGDGREILKTDPAKTAKQAIDPKVAFIMEQIMSDDDNRSMIFGKNTPLVLNGRRAGAKTGTTDNFTDAWTVGYTPSLASAFWFGNANSRPLTQGSDGIFVAAPAWHGFMQGALDSLNAPPGEWFGEPPGLGHAVANGKTVYLMPGTNANQPAPPLPPNVHSSSPAPCPPPAPSGDQGNNGNNNNNKPSNCTPSH